MRGRPIVGGMMLLAAAACATGRSAAEPDGVVRESHLDRGLTTLCDQGATTRTVAVPVRIVVRPNGTVATARADGPIRWVEEERPDFRIGERSLRRQAEGRATGCRFSEPTRGGQPVHARVQRTITVTY